ncbi:MAG: hypothetical protein ABIN91_04490 [Mucilaginibacter sp.]
MKKQKNIVTTLIIAISVFASHLLIDIYKIGIKDGKATQVAMAKAPLKK